MASFEISIKTDNPEDLLKILQGITSTGVSSASLNTPDGHREVDAPRSGVPADDPKPTRGKRTRALPPAPVTPPSLPEAEDQTPATSKEAMVDALKRVTSSVNLELAHRIVAMAMGKELGTVRVADVTPDKFEQVVQLCTQALAEHRGPTSVQEAGRVP